MLMIDPIQILWEPAGLTMPSLGDQPFVDLRDGDTPTTKMPIRMLSVDTPEVTGERRRGGPATVDKEFLQLAEWMSDRPKDIPISRRLAEVLRPKLATGRAGTLQFEQGKSASAFQADTIDKRLTKPAKKTAKKAVPGAEPPKKELRNIFIRAADPPFDNNNRVLAYIAPNYTPAEREKMSRWERRTFNLDLIAEGWAAPFIIFPSIPGELDLPMFLEKAEEAVEKKKGIWNDPNTLLAYEYRMMEKLHGIAEKIIVKGEKVTGAARLGWRERYCVDMRTRLLHGPEDYIDVPAVYRLWIWQADVQRAIGALNLMPAPRLVRA
jgi:endonuclease YncB( thermonuclease family)